jgi:DNA-directed RNA polymerase specialized sigma24 family protein
VVELRYFAGLTEDEVASVLGVTRRTVTRDWNIARTWLYMKLQEKGTHDPGSMAHC